MSGLVDFFSPFVLWWMVGHCIGLACRRVGPHGMLYATSGLLFTRAAWEAGHVHPGWAVAYGVPAAGLIPLVAYMVGR